ncbi:MAG: signal peptide peptidase SppA [Gammaproteobacteria bacterium]|nr:signal peptide peptidase SppA [Gammaproteobacteria bacterium]MCW8988348.1 signal peptide peptidase SppA [Gammaproteobacteria bacterium]
MIDEINSSKNKNNKEEWQADVISKLAFAAVNEQRRARKWSIFFKALFFVYLLVLFITAMSSSDSSGNLGKSSEHTALVEVKGVIADGGEASADNIIQGLRAAFKEPNAKAVILRINSPGGSPVQAGYVYDEIKRLRLKHKEKKVYAVISDMCASGGYYIAVAADEIYADKASIVGSIGVLMNGFGFTKAMDKMGVERRLYTAGTSKGFLDPFSEVKQSDKEHIQALLGTIHNQFISTVKEGRGKRLVDDEKLFTGLIWTGEESVALGLTDGLGSSSFVAREIIEAEKIIDYTPRPNYLDRLADRIGVAMASILSRSFNLQ